MRKSVLVAASCFATVGLVLSASADDNASGLSFRQRLGALSPIIIDAVTMMEAERGAAFTDSELRGVVKSPEFDAKHRLAVKQFCAKPENADNMACMPESRKTDAAGT